MCLSMLTWPTLTLKFFEPGSSCLFFLAEQSLFCMRTAKMGQGRSQYRCTGGETKQANWVRLLSIFPVSSGSIVSWFIITTTFCELSTMCKSLIKFCTLLDHGSDIGVRSIHGYMSVCSHKKIFYCSYLSTACRICVIQVFRSSLEVVWISYISGSLEEAHIRNMAFSSWATSLTISFWREITDGLLS